MQIEGQPFGRPSFLSTKDFWDHFWSFGTYSLIALRIVGAISVLSFHPLNSSAF